MSFRPHKINSNLNKLLEETTESYYWIGFLIADGHFSMTSRLILSISNKDALHLEKFVEYIDAESSIIHPINEKYVGIRLMDSHTLPKIKHKFSISNRKTYEPSNISHINNDNLLLSLIIGIIDGDGCIKNQYNRKDFSLVVKLHSCWLENLKFIARFISNKFNVHISEPKILSSGYAQLAIQNSETLKKLKEFVVNNNLPILERKWNKIDMNYISRYTIAKKRRVRAKELILKGYTHEYISKELGISRVAVTKMFSRGIDK